MRVGVIGVGVMGKHHARIYSEMSDVELVGVSDVNKEVAQKVASRHGTQAFTDYKELLKEGLDAVSIAVPTSNHCEVALDVASAGVNMLVEKPIADTIENARRIIDAAKKNGVKLMIGHIERFNPIIGVIRSLTKDINIVSIGITRVGPFTTRIKDVGVVIDLAVHDIDLLRHITGSEFKKVYSLFSNDGGRNEDTAILSFRMGNGVLARITTDWLTPYKVREISISSREKFIKGDFIAQMVKEFTNFKEDGSYSVKNIPVPHREPLKSELDAFIRCIKNNEEPPVSGEDGMKALETALLCLK